MAEGKVPKASEVETLLVLQQHKAKPFGENKLQRFLPGDKYKQAGLDKLEVIGSGKCTRDLKAEVPVNLKRNAPKPGEEMFTNPVEKLSAKIDALVDVVNKLINKK